MQNTGRGETESSTGPRPRHGPHPEKGCHPQCMTGCEDAECGSQSCERDSSPPRPDCGRWLSHRQCQQMGISARMRATSTLSAW